MKYTKTTLKELTRQYAIVLKKCAILNMLVLAGSLCATPAMADSINLDETYPDGVVSGNLIYQSGGTASLNTETVDVSGDVWARKGSSLLIGDKGQTNNVTVTAPSWTIYADTNNPAKQSLVSISANDTITVSTTGYGVGAMAGGRIDLKGKVVNIEATGTENDDLRAIMSHNNTTDATDNFATVNITADQINVAAENGIGISAMSQGRVNLIGDTTIKAKKAIVARGDAVVNINKDSDHIVKMDGDISFDFHKATSGTKIDALVDVTLSGDESYWNGNTVAAWSGEAPDESYLKVSSSSLTLKDGATWNAAKIIDSGDNTEGSKYAALNNLNIAKGNVNVLDTEQGIVVENVKTQDAAFSGGSLTVLNELSAENSTFKNSVSENSGGALHNQGTATLTGGSFENNSIKNTSTGYAYGGAVRNDGQMTIDNVAFTGNSIDTNGIGGAFFVGKDSETTISNSTFDSNTATWGGAGYTSTNAKQLTITDSQFTNNEAAGVGALGVFSKADLTNVSFTGNKATDAADDGAGALFLGAVSQTTITGGTFENNTSASVGGAIATRSGSQASNVDAKLDIVDTVFKNNTAGKSGGAIYNAFYSSQTDVSNVWIDNSSFEGNKAAENGGAIYNDGATDKVSNHTSMHLGKVAFSQNEAAGQGGAIFNGSTLTIEDGSEFVENNASQGGAISNVDGTLTLGNDIHFVGNTATVASAISNVGTAAGSASVTMGNNVLFDGNEADTYAGAILSQNANLTIGDSAQFLSNKSGVAGEEHSGGAIAMDSNQAEGQSTGIIGNNATFDGNIATKSGGAIYVYESSDADIAFKVGDNATFKDNVAAKNGGAVALYGTSGTIDGQEGFIIGSNASFSGNTAGGDGGAIYVSDFGNKTATLTVGPDAVFENNTANGEGGAIYNNGTVTFDGNATFANNTANGVANDVHNTGSLIFNGNTSFTGGVTGNGDIVFNGDKLDIGSSVIQGSSISIKDGSTLRANLLSGTAGFDAATLSGDNLNLIIEQGALGGSLVFAQGNADSLTFVNDNNLFDIVVQDGNVIIDRKATDSVVNQFVSTGVMDETTAMGVVTMTEAKGTTPQARALAAAIVELAQSKDIADQQKAGELAKAAQPTRAPIRHAVTTNTQVLRAASTRMAQLRQGRSGGDLAQAKLSPWVRGLFNKNHNSQGDGFDAYTHGFAFGVDAQVTEDWLIGLGYARTTSTVKEYNRRTHINGDNYFLYGKYQPAQWYIESTLNYGHNKNKVEAVGLTSDYSIDTYGAQLFSGYQYGIADNYAGIRYTYVKPDKYNNGLNMVNEKNTQVATAVIGTRIAKEFQYSDSVAFKPEFRLAGTYDFKSDNSVANVNVIGGNTLYSVDGRRLHRAALESGVGLTAKYGKMEVSADYDIEWRVSNFAQTGMLKLKYNF